MAKIINKDGQWTIEDNGTVTTIDKIVDDGKTLKLPTNSSNRQYFSIATFNKSAVNGELELTYKASVTITKTPGTQRTIKPLEDWLEGDDKAKYLELQKKAKEARDKANTATPKTELEKAQARLAKAAAELKAIEDAEAAKATSTNNPEAPASEPVTHNVSMADVAKVTGKGKRGNK